VCRLQAVGEDLVAVLHVDLAGSAGCEVIKRYDRPTTLPAMNRLFTFEMENTCTLVSRCCLHMLPLALDPRDSHESEHS
jgi:hypothetical protein